MCANTPTSTPSRAACRAEHPVLSDIGATGVPIIGINYKDQAANAERFLSELGDPFTRIGADTSGRAALDWGIYGVPETFVVDKHGVIRYKQIGPLTREALEQKILPLVRELRKA